MSVWDPNGYNGGGYGGGGNGGWDPTQERPGSPRRNPYYPGYRPPTGFPEPPKSNGFEPLTGGPSYAPGGNAMPTPPGSQLGPPTGGMPPSGLSTTMPTSSFPGMPQIPIPTPKPSALGDPSSQPRAPWLGQTPQMPQRPTPSPAPNGGWGSPQMPRRELPRGGGYMGNRIQGSALRRNQPETRDAQYQKRSPVLPDPFGRRF